MDILAFCMALLPIIWLIVALTVMKLPGHLACLSSLAIGVLFAIAGWHMAPLNAATAVLEGTLNALWPICLVVIAALFTYNLAVKTGAMETIKTMLASISPDKRMLALLIAWGFGNFMEGIAGFGTAVAIPASMLVTLGFNPLTSVVGCLMVNAMPTVFGSVGVPSLTLLSLTGIDPQPFCINVSLMECLVIALSPFLMVCVFGNGIRALRGMVGTVSVAALAFIVPWFITAAFVGPELPDTIGAACSMASIVLLAHKKAQKPVEPQYDIRIYGANNPAQAALPSAAEALRAWSPFIFITVLLVATSSLFPPLHDLIAPVKSSFVVYTGENPNTLTFSWINTPGVIIIVAAIFGGALQGATPRIMILVLANTLKLYWKTVVTICSVMALAKAMGYSGMISDIAAVLITAAGPFYPLVSPIIGVLGGFVTGSGTSTNVLFGSLQVQTAQGLGLNETWIAAGNAMGAGIGKMISPQSIAVGVSATNTVGSEPQVLKPASKFALIYTIIACVTCFAGSPLLA